MSEMRIAELEAALDALIKETERVAQSSKEYDDPHTHELLMDSTKRARQALSAERAKS